MKIKIRDIPTFYKILFPSIAITLMVTLTSTIFTYNKASEIILKKTVRQSQETVRQMSENYENFMQGIYDKINYIAYSATTQEELCYGEKGAYEEGYFSRERELKRQMVRLFNSFYVDDLQIYAKNGKDYYFSVKQEVKKPEKEEIAKMIQQATDAMGGIVCINDLKHSGHLQIVKEVRDNLKMSPIGTIRLSINSDALEQIRKNVNFASEGAVLILDEKNQIVQGQASELSKKADQLFQATEGEFEYQMQKKKYQVVYRVSDTTKWKVIGIIPLREISADLLPIQKQMIKTLMIGIFISSILSFLLSYVIVRPIRATVLAMHRFSEGDFEVRLSEERKDEFGEMNRVFNETTRKIEELMHEVTNSKLLNKEMEFKALQAQINPHFLYNTLDSIIWMAEAGQNDDVVLMTSALAKLLRQSISNDKEQVRVEEEINYVQSYLTIQKMRYKDKLEYTIDVDPEICGVSIIKFAIQPLVENAIYHGLKYKDTKGKISIHGYVRGKKGYITITDDGVGMDEETLKYIFDEKQKKEKKPKSNGVGVPNVQKRLQLYYGPEYGISYISRQGEGTVATVTIPLDGGENHE